jgi:serine/threonine protein kinase
MATAPRDDLGGIRRFDSLLRLVQQHLASGADREEFLAAHESDRELLEPMLDDQRADDAAGQNQVGDYELVRVLGSGGSGVVYEAVHTTTDQPAAVKKLLADVGEDRARARFQREARLCASVRHENVVRLLSAGVHLGQPYLAMELVRGVPLSGLLAVLAQAAPGDAVDFWVILDRQLEAQGFAATSEQRAVRSHEPLLRLLVDMLRRVALALHAVHVAGIVHRDVKPANVLICGDGKPVLTDFGVARSEGELGITLTGEATGTPYYLAPEQHEVGADRLTARTDVFSLGVTLYEAVTGRRPFEGPSRLALAEQIRHQRPVDPRRLAAGIDRDLAAITMKAVEKAPGDRYPSAAAMAADLEAWLRGGSVLARPMPLWQRGLRWARRNRLATVVGLVLASGAVTMGRLAWIAEQRATLLRQTRVMADLAGWVGEVRGMMERGESLVSRPAAESRYRQLDQLLRREGELSAKAYELSQSDPATATALRFTAERLAEHAPWLGVARKWQDESLRQDADWGDVRRSIEQGEAAPSYRGLAIKPQAGLRPLRCNSTTRLWEFWHTASGVEPKLDVRGRWVVARDTGIVFILIPPRQDYHAFFIAAHELTQSQWTELTTPDHPGRSFHPTLSKDRSLDGATYPLDTVAPKHAHQVLGAWGLSMPAMQDWLVAYCELMPDWSERMLGPFPATMSYLRDPGASDSTARPVSLPVGSLAPQAQGCYDLIGNVWELVFTPGHEKSAYHIGGHCFDSPRHGVDVQQFHPVRPDHGADDIGVRASRPWYQ